MCGRYVLALRYGQVQRVLDDHGLPTGDFHQGRGGRSGRGRDYWGDGTEGDQGDDADEGDDGAEEADASADADTNGDAPDESNTDAIFQPSYNFAPGFHGIVIRPVRDDSSEKGAPDASDKDASNKVADDSKEKPPYQLQVMKWGLIPSWMRKRPDYSSMLKTINCRSDSLVSGSGMWAGLRSRKRCIVVASGFYEWLNKGPRERVPHYIRRRDGLPLLMAGLWDRVVFDGVETYTYTIITTDSNATLRFLHDRMPVLLDYGSSELAAWLDKDREWSSELGALLKPWPMIEPGSGGSLLVDVVSKEVNKTGHSSPSFIVPVASAENKSNIANFFKDGPTTPRKTDKSKEGTKRAAEEESPRSVKKLKVGASPAKEKTELERDAKTPSTPSKPFLRSAKNNKTPGNAVKAARASAANANGSQKITSFFGKG